jgi:hypothetical protein
MDFLPLTDIDYILPTSAKETRRALMTTEDLKRLETIEHAYEQRIELGQLLACVRTSSCYCCRV